MKLCIYGASSNQIHKNYLDAGELLGGLMAQRGHQLVFGGGATGMMGAVVRGLTKEKGTSLGIAPHFFQQPGILYEDCTEFIFTDTMRERKELMENLSDGFIMTPGGIGTYEEFFEVLTLKQLGQHEKPIGILNTDGYFQPLKDLLDITIAKGFMKADCRNLYIMEENPEKLLEMMEQLHK